MTPDEIRDASIPDNEVAFGIASLLKSSKEIEGKKGESLFEHSEDRFNEKVKEILSDDINTSKAWSRLQGLQMKKLVNRIPLSYLQKDVLAGKWNRKPE